MKTIPVYKPGDKYHRSVAIKPPGADKLIQFVLPEEVKQFEETHFLVYLVDHNELVSVLPVESLLAAQWIASEFILNIIDRNATEH